MINKGKIHSFFIYTLFALTILFVFNIHSLAGATEAEEILSIQDGDLVLGDPDAKIKIFDYSSLSCHHCADYHDKVFKNIKKEYIDTNKIAYVVRDFPTNAQSLKGLMLVKCLQDKGKKLKLIESLFKYQANWVFVPNFEEALQNFALLIGIDKERFAKCVNDKEVEQKLLKDAYVAATTLDINATPTIFINQKMYSGKFDYESCKNVIDAELNK